MRRKIAWIFVWTTLAFWLGCGENQNYRINQEETPVLESPRSSLSNPTPSITGTDRSHWPQLTASPTPATISHLPHYFDRNFACGCTWSFTKDRPSPLLAEGEVIEASFLQAESGDDDSMGLRDAGDAFLSPAKFGLDVVSLPIRAAAVDRPWATRTTPKAAQ